MTHTSLSMTLKPVNPVNPVLAKLATIGLDKAYTVFVSMTDRYYEERIIRDIVGKLMEYGSLSDKQINFVKTLLDKIENRAIVEANAKPVPTTEGRVTVKGKVLSIKESMGRFPGYKMLLVHEDGYKLYGSLPRSISNVEKGDTVELTATVKKSDRDDKFGFFSRPSNAKIVK